MRCRPNEGAVAEAANSNAAQAISQIVSSSPVLPFPRSVTADEQRLDEEQARSIERWCARATAKAPARSRGLRRRCVWRRHTSTGRSRSRSRYTCRCRPPRSVWFNLLYQRGKDPGHSPPERTGRAPHPDRTDTARAHTPTAHPSVLTPPYKLGWFSAPTLLPVASTGRNSYTCRLRERRRAVVRYTRRVVP